MGGPPVVHLVGPGIGTRLDRAKEVVAIIVGHGPPTAAEIGVHRRQVVVLFVPIASARVCLPDFYQRVAHGLRVLIQNAAVQDDPLADGGFAAGGIVRQQIVVAGRDVGMVETGSGDFRHSVFQRD